MVLVLTFLTLHDFFALGCSNVFLPDRFSSDVTRLVQSVRDAKLLQSNLIIFTTNGDMANTCGPFSESILTGTAHLTQEELCTAAAALHESRKHLACSRWDPIYTTMTQEVLCTDAMDALAWITISQLVIVFVSMLILTFRVAILPIKYVRWQPRAKQLSKQVTADLKKISGLAHTISKERLKQTKVEPVYQLKYGSSAGNSDSSENGTAESVLDYNAEVSTTEPSYSGDSNSLQTKTTSSSEQMASKISPRMVDDDDDDDDPEVRASNVTFKASNQQMAAPIMEQSIKESLDEDNVDTDMEEEKKPESESMRSESIPPASERSMLSVSACSTALNSHQEEEEEGSYSQGYKKPNSYSMESVPTSHRSLTSAGLSVESTPQSAIRVLMDKGALVRHKSLSDDSSFEEVTIRSDSEFEEATYYSMSSLKKSSGLLSVSETTDGGGSKKSSSHSERKSMHSLQSAHSRLSSHSQGSQRFLTSLEDVAEEPTGNGNNNPANPESKASPFAPGNAFMDHLLVDDKAHNSSLGADTNSILVDTASDKFEASARDLQGGDEEFGLLGPPRNPKRKDDVGRTSRSSRSLKDIEAVKIATEQAQSDGEEFHFSLNLDMATFQSTDFGDFSESQGSINLDTDTPEIVEYEIIEEIMIPEDGLPDRPYPIRRSTSISALSVDPDDPAYKSFNSTDLGISGRSERMSTVSGDNMASDAKDQGSHQKKKPSTDANDKIVDQSKDGAGYAPATKQIDIHALQKRVDSIRSLGSASAGIPKGRLKNQNRSSLDPMKRAESIRSFASGPSVAISAATMNEKQFYLDDDIGGGGGGSSDSFGNAILPSRAIDSEMLAAVDETWVQDEEKPSSSQLAKAQMRNLARDLRPQTHGWRVDSKRSLGSGRSSGRPDEQGRKVSVNSALTDDFKWRSSWGSATQSRGPSIRSMASGPSVAISAATMDEKQFYLDDDNAGSSNSFGLPSRAIDSEMLAVVDEAWMEDLEEQEAPSSKLKKEQLKNRPSNGVSPLPSQPRRLTGKQIFVQKRADSVRSLGMDSFSGGMNEQYDGSFDKPVKPRSGLLSLGSKKPQSVGSMASGPSVAISAATMNEKQFFLDDDNARSADSFGAGMLPSRAIDSEMLAVVDETWTEDLEDQEMQSSKSEKAKLNNHQAVQPHQPSQPSRLTGKQIFLQKGADSVRSLGMDSYTAGMNDEYDSSFDKPMKLQSGLSLGTSWGSANLSRGPSVRSMASGPSIAISAATMDEKQFHLDDDLGGSSGTCSFGLGILPSKGMDSEMLAVVDEALAEDAPETPSNRRELKAHDDSALKTSQLPGTIETNTLESIKMDSDPSVGDVLEKSAEISLVDPFEKSIEISAAR